MALKKEIILDNGITLNYHRIVSLNKITNISNVIEIASYTSREQREKEEAYQKLQQKNIQAENSLTSDERISLENGINIFIETDIVNIKYDANMTVETAYEYLKTTEKYENAENC